jgi:hypothetical protein
MRKTVAALLVAAALALALGGPASAHQAPCGEAAFPGHSEYARHHLVPLAAGGGLAAAGHIPGTEHQGYAGLCGVLAP